MSKSLGNTDKSYSGDPNTKQVCKLGIILTSLLVAYLLNLCWLMMTHECVGLTRFLLWGWFNNLGRIQYFIFNGTIAYIVQGKKRGCFKHPPFRMTFEKMVGILSKTIWNQTFKNIWFSNMFGFRIFGIQIHPHCIKKSSLITVLY